MNTYTTMVQALLDWFFVHKRPLPWRTTYSPYHVWISEIMLQQTQMDRGVDYFKRWMQRFPDICAVAEANEDVILKNWEGLGYYSRARNLHRAARLMCARHDCQVPYDIKHLLALPGIGPYTAAAIASIAFNQDVCVTDGNVERVMSRLLDITAPIKSREAQALVENACVRLLPPGHARDFNQSLMEFGSLVCSPRVPGCPACPLAAWCAAWKLGVHTSRPVTVKPPKPIYISMATGVLLHNGCIFVQKRNPDDVWGNLWEFPGGIVEDGENPASTVVREYLEETQLRVKWPESIDTFRHSYTRYRVTMHAYHVTLTSDPNHVVLTAAQEYRWVTWKELQKLAFPAGHRKLITALSADAAFRARIH